MVMDIKIVYKRQYICSCECGWSASCVKVGIGINEQNLYVTYLISSLCIISLVINLKLHIPGFHDSGQVIGRIGGKEKSQRTPGMTCLKHEN